MTKQLEGWRISCTGEKFNFPSTSDHFFNLKFGREVPYANFFVEQYFTEKNKAMNKCLKIGHFQVKFPSDPPAS